MSAPVPTREECWAGAYAVLERALGRLARAEAAGTLTPTEARVMAKIRAGMAAREAAAQQRAA